MKPTSDGTRIGILTRDGAEVVISFQEFCRRLDVDGWVRLQRDDYAALATLETEFVHFNLEATSNEPGRRYALVPILRPGKRRPDGTEQLPVVDIERGRIAVCVEVVQRLPIRMVSASQFQHSLPSIRTPEALERALHARYAALFPGVAPADLLARGCALTRLRFVD